MLMMLALDGLLIGGPGQMMLMMLALGLAAYWRAWANDAHALDGLLIGGPGHMMLMMLALGLAAYWRAWANDAHDACPWTGCLLEGLGK